MSAAKILASLGRITAGSKPSRRGDSHEPLTPREWKGIWNWTDGRRDSELRQYHSLVSRQLLCVCVCANRMMIQVVFRFRARSSGWLWFQGPSAKFMRCQKSEMFDNIRCFYILLGWLLKKHKRQLRCGSGTLYSYLRIFRQSTLKLSALPFEEVFLQEVFPSAKCFFCCLETGWSWSWPCKQLNQYWPPPP